MKNVKQPTGTYEYEGKDYNIFEFYNEEFNYSVKLIFIKERYSANNSLCISALDIAEEEPFTVLTVNLSDPQQMRPNHAFFDINNCGWIKEQLEEYGLMKPAEDNYTHKSGFVIYPLYEWNINLFREGGEKPKFYIDMSYYRDGQGYGCMSWTFEDKPDTETEDFETAKANAEELIKEFPFDEEEQEITKLFVVNEDNDELWSIVNVSEETANAQGVTADKYITVTEQEN